LGVHKNPLYATLHKRSPMPPPFNPSINLPINAQYYQPSVFDISALTLGVSTTVTTSVNHNYVIGQTIRLHIPAACGSYQLSGQQGQVISIPAADEVVVNINSTQANAFIPNPPDAPTLPQICAIGDVNSGSINSSGRSNTGTFVPGSFINISPA
jgi:hypothetical protein